MGGIPQVPFGTWAYLGSVQIGALLSVSAAFTLGLTHINNSLRFMILALIVYLLLRAGSRGSMLAVCVIFMFALKRYLIGNGLSRKAFFRVLLAVIFLSPIFLNIGDIIVLNDRLNSLQNLDQDGSFGYRLLSIVNGWNELIEHPFGSGFAREGKVIFNEHNLFVWVAVAMGLPGLLFLLYKIRILWKSDVYYLRLLVIALLVNGFSDPMLMEGIQSLFVSMVVCLGMVEFKLRTSGNFDL